MKWRKKIKIDLSKQKVSQYTIYIHFQEVVVVSDDEDILPRTGKL